MILTIPTRAKPAQRIDVVLGSQLVTIDLRTMSNRLYCTVTNGSASIVQGRICKDRTPIVNEDYRGFSGDLFFMDAAGKADPQFSELGTRFLLCYSDEFTL